MADRRNGPRRVFWWRSWRSAVFDVVLALLAGGLPVIWGDWLAAVAFPALVARRRWPLPVAVLVVVGSAIIPAMTPSALVGLYTLAAYGRARLPLALVAGAELVALRPWTHTRIETAIYLGIALSFVLLGLFVGARRALLASLREQAEHLQRERRLLADQAVRGERARIAREMHDVVADRVGLMLLHADALTTDAGQAGPGVERTTEAARQIQAIGRRGLEELRQVIGLLRVETDQDGDENRTSRLSPPAMERAP